MNRPTSLLFWDDEVRFLDTGRPLDFGHNSVQLFRSSDCRDLKSKRLYYDTASPPSLVILDFYTGLTPPVDTSKAGVRPV